MKFATRSDIDAHVMHSGRHAGMSWLFDALETNRAILDDHFSLCGEQHARYFLRFRAFALDRTAIAGAVDLLAAEIPGGPKAPTRILCPESAGFELGRALSRRLALPIAVLAVDRTRRPVPRLVTGQLDPDDKVLLVNDIITTGQALVTMSRFVTSVGGQVRHIAVFATQGDAARSFAGRNDVPVSHLVHTHWPLYAADACPLCREGGAPLPAAEFN
jgi:orotate phosphoribosyltransferase